MTRREKRLSIQMRVLNSKLLKIVDLLQRRQMQDGKASKNLQKARLLLLPPHKRRAS
jgi:hypothetical protein